MKSGRIGGGGLGEGGRRKVRRLRLTIRVMEEEGMIMSFIFNHHYHHCQLPTFMSISSRKGENRSTNSSSTACIDNGRGE